MFDNTKAMLVLKGEPKTYSVKTCYCDELVHKYKIAYDNGKEYPYAYENVEWINNPERILPENVRIHKNGQLLYDITEIFLFRGKHFHCFYRIVFKNGGVIECSGDEIQIEKSCLANSKNKSVLAYLKNVAQISTLRNDKGEKILSKQFEKVEYVGENNALAYYLSGRNASKRNDISLIFPFGCNKSQYAAVKNALCGGLSVIQGPPGTGKTQTILNIIANLIIQGKTVQVVSNNNSATENVQEKLELPKYNLGFIVAKLGKSDNKKEFINSQNTEYPDFSDWIYKGNSIYLAREISDMTERLQKVFDVQEQLAKRRQELSDIETEWKHFEQYLTESDVDTNVIKLGRNTDSKRVMDLWQRWQNKVNLEQKINLIERIRAFVLYGIKNVEVYKSDISKVITSLQAIYLSKSIEEIKNDIENLELFIERQDVSLDELSEKSMIYFKDVLAKRYNKNSSRQLFTEEDFWKNPDSILKEYPVTLSTTFASKSSLGSSRNLVEYDYLIMDEASQVDIATGALALSTAHNAVIVGDMKQLPNVITNSDRELAKKIFAEFDLAEGYKFTNSFLKSVLEVVDGVPNVLLREHYRCHPKIINFCNQKFYNGELVIMTKDNGEEGVIQAVKTAIGNHERDHFNQRQIDVIKEEILPNTNIDLSEVGIIAPYRNQVEVMQRQIPEVEINTVHKFQGKEKDAIIISTVDDEITDFSDDPFLINVAVSRAKQKLFLVVSGNEQSEDSNIADLVSYIEYNNCSVTESKVYSVFDYMYSQYTEARLEFLAKYKKISEYDSENLLYALISDLLQKNGYNELGVICHLPLNMLIRNPENLDDIECKYAMNPGTHLDFLIYNKISKKHILAIEVDGYSYHKAGTVQAERDKLKNTILQKYDIPLLRFSTVGSGEERRLLPELEKLLVRI